MISSAPVIQKLTDQVSLNKILPDLSDKIIVLAGGIFDLLKPFHIDLIEYAKELGDILVVAVAEESRYTPLDERLEILNEIELIDYLVIYKDKMPQSIPQNFFNEIIVSEEFNPAGIRSDFSGRIIKFPV